jgi:mRNA interferase RelE/StbE
MITLKSAIKKRMSKYKITISRTAQKQLDKLSDKIAKPLLVAIAELADEPRPQGCKKLKGRDVTAFVKATIE